MHFCVKSPYTAQNATLASVMKAAGYYQHHLDMCVFSKRQVNGSSMSITAVLIIHVGDILTCGSVGEIRLFSETIKKFETGEIVSLQKKLKFAFCRLTLIWKGSSALVRMITENLLLR